MSENKTVDPKSLHFRQELVPLEDARFAHLAERALSNALDLYFAAVPLATCIPFDPDYRPDLHPVGAAAIREARNLAVAGRHQNILVYQRGFWFVVADDYIPYFAALSGLPDYVPCFVLGKPDHPLVKDMQGPIDAAGVQKIFGFTR